jgi:hypothetical protein
MLGFESGNGVYYWEITERDQRKTAAADYAFSSVRRVNLRFRDHSYSGRSKTGLINLSHLVSCELIGAQNQTHPYTTQG